MTPALAKSAIELAPASGISELWGQVSRSHAEEMCSSVHVSNVEVSRLNCANTSPEGVAGVGEKLPVSAGLLCALTRPYPFFCASDVEQQHNPRKTQRSARRGTAKLRY